ncbi:hypothetical protein FDG2_5528 [Candidatus Protofrankia californiensis]|uniref:ABC3 transporter permease C-terminal domain-containing protein n=1 Tax=Candidatus Protofrankia californiensis TaxID=1839754 RepID=A0A1C3PEL1_9ACTN|nr:hypothetical protein FDG2_5528 [Candidatus Protofrankia californiensis]
MIGVVIAAWYDVRTRPLRTLAAVAGMVAAIAALVTIDAAGVLSREGSSDYLRRQFGQPATMEISISGSATASRRARTQALLPAALPRSGIPLISGYAEVRGVVLAGDRSVVTDTAAVDPSYRSIRVVDLLAGMFPARSVSAGALRGVIDEAAARELGWEPGQAVGRQIGLVMAGTDANPDLRSRQAVPVVVDAVMRHPVDGRPAPGLLVVGGLTAHGGLASDTGGRPPVWLVRVAPGDVRYLREVVTSMERDLTVGGLLNVRRLDQDDTLAPVIEQQTRTARIVAWVTMAVGGLGMLGVGISTVRERGRELGIRRALGAPRTAIFFGIIVETVLNVLVAAAVAVPLAALVVYLLPGQLVVGGVPRPPDAALPLSSAVRGIAAATAVGLLAGVVPAARAARLSVIAAIRG